MSNIPVFSGLDDEEDLEALRLAALQSLKKSNALPDSHMLQAYPHPNVEQPQFWQSKGFRNKKGKPFGMQYTGWGNRNFQTHFSRVRSTNLISIPTVSGSEEISQLPDEKNSNKDEDGEKSQDSCSKFERYNNSDKSESESEEEADVLLSDGGSPRLKKSDSLEALMQELDNEIQGKPISEEKVKGKKSKKRKKEASASETVEAVPVKGDPEKSVAPDGDQATKISKTDAPGDHKEPQQMPTEERNNQSQGDVQSPARKRPRSKSPPHKRNFYNNRRRQRNFVPHPQNVPMMLPYGPGPVPFQPHMMPFNGQPFNPMFGPPGVIPTPGVPPFFENPLPPLTINPEPLPTPILAPLSPRSAAFVLENKAIVERRRRSPRRSYSRSPSRSPVRSLSPRRSPRWSVSPRRSPQRRLPPRKRSLTPKRKSISPRRKSISPKRMLSPSRRKSLSPRRKSISPRRKSMSPRRRSLTPRKRSLSPRSPNRKKSPSPKRKAGDVSSSRAPIRDRLGVKSRTDDKEKPKQTEESPKKDDKPLDPVLEARRRKFESNEIKIKEGIIRLRPKDDKPKEEKTTEPKDKESKPNTTKPKEDRQHSDKPKEEKKNEKPKPQKDEPAKDLKTEKKEPESRSTTPKPKENIVEVAPATTTTEDKQTDDSVPDEFKELEKLLLGDDIELDPKVEDIFSDEDSASDNEGRFKVKEGQGRAKPPVISFTKLVNGEKRDIKSEPLAKYAKNNETSSRERPISRSRSSGVDKKDKKSSFTVEEKEKKKPYPEKSITARSLAKQRISFRTERPPPTMDKRFERKIEIKIKNPSKYERSGKSKVVSKSEAASSSSSNVDRKVNVDDRDDDDSEEEEDDDFEPEIIVDNGSDDEYSNVNEGDLRAQLSKKRAEKKLHKIPVDEVSSRLLKYALKGAVFKKSKKKSKDKDISSSDAKPPIHLRLGLGNQLELFAETRTKRKSRKRKNREILEQLEYHVVEK